MHRNRSRTARWARSMVSEKRTGFMMRWYMFACLRTGKNTKKERIPLKIFAAVGVMVAQGFEIRRVLLQPAAFGLDVEGSADGAAEFLP